MSNLIQLRNQIKSIQATLKMTQAIRLVSMSMYNRLEQRKAALAKYLHENTKILVNFIHHPAVNSHPLLKHHADGQHLIVLVSTTKGLCGSLNANLFRLFEQRQQDHRYTNTQLITIGQKAKKYAQDKGLTNILCHYNELNAENYRSLTKDLINRIFSGNQKFASITFYGNHLKSFFKQVPQAITLTPLTNNSDIIKECPKSASDHMQQASYEHEWAWEQPAEDIFEAIISSYLNAHISLILYESLLAEHAARFFAMDNSTTNAQKLLENLSLQYNKQRQTLITKEVAELSAVIPQQ